MKNYPKTCDLLLEHSADVAGKDKVCISYFITVYIIIEVEKVEIKVSLEVANLEQLCCFYIFWSVGHLLEIQGLRFNSFWIYSP